MMKQILLAKHAKLLVPTAHLKQVLNSGVSCVGLAATTTDDKGNPMIAVEHQSDLKGVGSIDDVAKWLDEIQNNFKNNHILMWFADDPGMVTVGADNVIETHDMCPYPVISTDDGTIHVVAALAGDFSGYAQEQSKHSDLFFAIQEDLIPRLHNLAEGKETAEEIMEEVQTNNLFLKDLKRLSKGDAGIVSLLSSNGTLFTVSKQDGHVVGTDYGWATMSFAAEQKVEPKKSALGGALSKFSLKGKPKAEGPVEASPELKPEEKIEPKVDIPPKPDEKPQTVKEAAKATTVADVMPIRTIKCPPHINGKQSIRDWYQKNAGFIPDGYKHKPDVKVQIVPDTKDLKQLDKVIAAKVTPTKAAEPKPKDVEVKNKEITKSNLPLENALSVIPAEAKEALKVDKTLDRNSQKIKTLEELEKDEAKLPSLFEQTGLTLLDAYCWTDKQRLHFLKQHDRAALALFRTLLGVYARSEQFKKDIEPATPEVEEKTETPTKVVATGSLSKISASKFSLSKKKVA